MGFPGVPEVPWGSQGFLGFLGFGVPGGSWGSQGFWGFRCSCRFSEQIPKQIFPELRCSRREVDACELALLGALARGEEEYAPSRLQAIVSAKALARKLTGRGGPSARVETSDTFVNPFAPMAKTAIHLPSGDQTGRGVSSESANVAVPMTRSCLDASSRTCSSLRLRKNASDCPSGENTGDISVAMTDESGVSFDVLKS